MNRRFVLKKGILLLVVILAMLLSACERDPGANADESAGTDAADASSRPDTSEYRGLLSHEGYELKQVLVMSRHNIRSPLTGEGSVLDTMTPHEWFAWSSDPSDLSIRGGILETEMGQFFRKWAETEGLFPEDYLPTDDEIRIYSNAKQRTIATATFFAAGLVPVGDIDVEYHAEYDSMDPVFNPQLTSMTETFKGEAEAQIRELFTERIESLADNYKLLSNVIDIEESDDYKSGNFTGFKTDDTELIIEENKEPGMTGSLKTACSISDALVLQYYEGTDEQAAFGKELTDREWEEIAEIKDTYQDVLFTAPLIACNVANPLLREIRSELNAEGRKFTFLCGHDSNLGSILSALSVEDYELENAIEKKTPIGCKVVLARWIGRDGREYISADLVYQTKNQLREMDLLDQDNPPAISPIILKDMPRNEDGLYKADEFMRRLDEAIAKLDAYNDDV